MDVRELPLVGGLFQGLSDYVAQGLLQRAAVYFVAFLASVLIAGGVVVTLGIYDVVGPGGTLLLSMVVLGFIMYGIDPENEYTKEDVMALWIVMAVAPAVVMMLHAATGAAIAQVASPLIVISEMANGAGVEAATPAMTELSKYLLHVVAYGGVLFATMSTKYVMTA